jgi:hypothetical protein
MNQSALIDNLSTLLQALVTAKTLKAVYPAPVSEVTGYPYVFFGDVNVTSRNETTTETRYEITIPVVVVTDVAGKGKKTRTESAEIHNDATSAVMNTLNGERRASTVLGGECDFILALTSASRRGTDESPVATTTIPVTCVILESDK